MGLFSDEWPAATGETLPILMASDDATTARTLPAISGGSPQGAAFPNDHGLREKCDSMFNPTVWWWHD
jgi:hypothetical protein